jgi:hypothetical protein
MAGCHNIVPNARPGALHAGATRMAKTTNVVVRNVNQANRYSGFYLTRCAVGVASAESGSRINGIKKGGNQEPVGFNMFRSKATNIDKLSLS